MLNDIDLARHAVERIYSLPPIVEWCGALIPNEFPPPHTIPILKSIRRAVVKQQKILVEMPPGHAKTTTMQKALAWWIKHFPADTCAYFTYNDRKGQSKSRYVRELVRRAGVQIDPRVDGKGEWRTLEGGGLIAGGVGGGLTGERVKGLFVLDDPYKNRKDAESVVKREDIWDWTMDVALTRLFQGATPVIMHTRWHPSDVIGELRKRPEWRVISLPAICEVEGDIMGRAMGQPLWPEMFSLAELEAVRRDIGEWSWASLYQQRPAPRDSNLFGQPSFHSRLDPLEGGAGWRMFIACDPAITEDTKADYSVAVAIAARMDGDHLIGRVVDVIRGQWESPELVRRLEMFSQKHYGAAIGVEAVGGFKAVPQTLRALNPRLRVVDINPRGDKYVRAQLAGAAWNQGRLTLPEGVPWLKALIDECSVFTGNDDPEDDQVDALSHAWNMAVAAFQQVPSGSGKRARPDVGRWRG